MERLFFSLAMILLTAGVASSALADGSQSVGLVGEVGRDPGRASRAVVAVIVDVRGLGWCDGDRCMQSVQVLSVIENRSRYAVPKQITVTHVRGGAPLTSIAVFLRIECGTGPVPLWRLFPANEPVTEKSGIFLASFGAPNKGLQQTRPALLFEGLSERDPASACK
jgi:hypothetical protein